MWGGPIQFFYRWCVISAGYVYRINANNISLQITLSTSSPGASLSARVCACNHRGSENNAPLTTSDTTHTPHVCTVAPVHHDTTHPLALSAPAATRIAPAIVCAAGLQCHHTPPPRIFLSVYFGVRAVAVSLIHRTKVTGAGINGARRWARPLPPQQWRDSHPAARQAGQALGWLPRRAFRPWRELLGKGGACATLLSGPRPRDEHAPHPPAHPVWRVGGRDKVTR